MGERGPKFEGARQEGGVEREPEREWEPRRWEPDARIEIIRHGEPTYSSEEMRNLEMEGRIVDEDVPAVEKAAVELAKEIDPEREYVIIWKSPRRRARETAEIYGRKLREAGIEVDGAEGDVGAVIESVRDIDIKDKKKAIELMGSETFRKELKSGKPKLQIWYEEHKKGEGGLGEVSESPAEVARRTLVTLAIIERVVRGLAEKGEKKTPRILIPAHGEIGLNFAEALKGKTISEAMNDVRLDVNERVSLGLKVGDPGKGVLPKVRIGFRGEEGEFDFDTKKRELIPIETSSDDKDLK